MKLKSLYEPLVGGGRGPPWPPGPPGPPGPAGGPPGPPGLANP